MGAFPCRRRDPRASQPVPASTQCFLDPTEPSSTRAPFYPPSLSPGPPSPPQPPRRPPPNLPGWLFQGKAAHQTSSLQHPSTRMRRIPPTTANSFNILTASAPLPPLYLATSGRRQHIPPTASQPHLGFSTGVLASTAHLTSHQRTISPPSVSLRRQLLLHRHPLPDLALLQHCQDPGRQPPPALRAAPAGPLTPSNLD